MSEALILFSSNNSDTPSITANSGSDIEVSTFLVSKSLPFSKTKSVKVPPISIANLIY